MKKISQYIIILLTIGLLQSCVSARTAQELQLGKMTFEAGDYKLAFHELLPLAVDGNAEAQYAIGYMYYYGYGPPQDEVVGLFWMNKAAGQYYAPAIEALEKIHQKNIKRKVHRTRPEFQNGVPKVVSEKTKPVSPKLPPVKVLTNADLPLIEKIPSVETDLANKNPDSSMSKAEPLLPNYQPQILVKNEAPKNIETEIQPQKIPAIQNPKNKEGENTESNTYQVSPEEKEKQMDPSFRLIVYGPYSTYYPLKPAAYPTPPQRARHFTPWVHSVIV